MDVNCFGQARVTFYELTYRKEPCKDSKIFLLTYRVPSKNKISIFKAMALQLCPTTIIQISMAKIKEIWHLI